jgi:hypothetical protein
MGATTLATVPSPPRAVVASAGDGQATVSWTVPSSNGGAAIIDYTVTSSPGNVQATVSSTTAVVTGLTNGTGYTFTVKARNTAGSSAASAASATVTPVAAAAGSGTTYYLSTTGSDAAAGSSASPWATFAHALGQLNAGDTLLVRGGLYNEGRNCAGLALNPGASGNRVLVKSFGTERPVLQGLLWMSGIDYWTFDGINVTWDTATGTSSDHMFRITGGSGWRVTNAEIWGAQSFACMHIAGTPSNFRIDNCYIHDNPGPHGSNNQDHLIYANCDLGGGIIERCILANSPWGRGVKIGPQPTTDPVGNVEVRYNNFYNNGGPANIQVSYTASGNFIHHNILQKPKNTSTENITAFSISSGNNNTVANNVGWESAAVFQSSPAIIDGGGNFMADPQYVNAGTSDNHAWNAASTLDWHPQNSAVASYGRYAP